MYERFGKRVLDLMVTVPALVVLSPLMLGAAIWVKLGSNGPILFKHLRAGKGRVPFMIYKFRSMAVEAPKDVATSDLRDADAYITRSGKIMRKLSIDELPQLFNVIKGDMSIVGPRPVVLAEETLLDLREKHGALTVKPGVTGWAQVNGRDALSPGEKAYLDAYYAEHVNFLFDIKCIVLTVWAVITLAGHSEGHEKSSQSRPSRTTTETEFYARIQSMQNTKASTARVRRGINE